MPGGVSRAKEPPRDAAMGARSTAPLWWWRWWRGPLVGEGTKGLFLLSAGCSRLPPLLTGGEGGLGGPPEDLHGLVVPLDDVALQAGGAVGQGQDLRRGQHVVPHAELRQLPHEGLCGIKAAAQRVLGMGKGMEVRLASREAPSDPINQSPVHHGPEGTCSWPRMMTPWGLMACHEARFSPAPRCSPSWYADHLPSRVVHATQMWCQALSFRLSGSWATFGWKARARHSAGLLVDPWIPQAPHPSLGSTPNPVGMQICCFCP